MNQRWTFNKQLIVDFDGKIALSDVKTIEIEELDIVSTVSIIGVAMVLVFYVAMSSPINPETWTKK